MEVRRCSRVRSAVIERHIKVRGEANLLQSYHLPGLLKQLSLRIWKPDWTKTAAK